MRLTSTLVLVLGVAAFAAPASAGNGNGNGNGNGQASPGNSATAPGQEKKEEAVAAPAASAPVPSAAPAVAAPATETVPSAGVKPSNSTQHETHAAASSNATKQYGNGQTAGAIAQKHGAAPQTILHGPGNSQPHKAAPCSGGHEVDVHALKAHNRRGHCGGSPSPPSSPGPSTEPHSPPPSGPGSANSAKLAGAETPKSSPEPKPEPEPRRPADPAAPGPVREPTARAGEAQGVLSETAVVAGAQLPFTGLELWLALLAGTGMILLGVAIRTAGRRVESGRDHTNRTARPGGGAPAPVRSRARR